MVAPLDPPKSDCILFIINLPCDSEAPNNRPTSCQLEVPLVDLKQLVLRPVRWLKLVAWGILNCTGNILNEHQECLHEDIPFDQFPVCATYTFLPDEDATCSLMNIKHVSTISTSSSHSDTLSSSSHRDSDQDALVVARDGDYCVFSGSDIVDRTHILPRRATREPTSLQTISAARGFAFDDELDARNRLTVDVLIWKSWTALGKCFILATDPDFVRDQDVPEPLGMPPPGLRTRARVGVSGETYIWQSLVGKLLDVDSSVLTAVRLNERARFANATPEPRPCARAVNYVYAVGMVKLYRRQCPDGDLWLLSRPLPVASPTPAGERKRRRDSPDSTLGEFDAASLTQVERVPWDEDAVKRRRVQDWRDASAVVSMPE